METIPPSPPLNETPSYANMLKRKYQIFVSSTYDDLKEERRAVIEAILRMKHIPIGMELFQAGNTDQWSYIKNRILESDYYVIIVAERYGSTIADGMSYTELEYRFAVENGIPVAAFLLDDKSRPSWPNIHTEFEKKTQIEEFRKLCSQKIVSYWNDAGELSTKCLLALMELFEAFPRTGWVPSSLAADPIVFAQLATLSH